MNKIDEKDITKKTVNELKTDIENKILFYLNRSTMPFLTLIDNWVYYDEYYNHIYKRFQLEFKKEDIIEAIKQSEKFYWAYVGGKYVVGFNDGTGKVNYNRYFEKDIKIFYNKQEIKES